MSPDQLNRADVQGFVLRTYAMPALRVLVLKIEESAAAKRFLGSLVSGGAEVPQLATATEWKTKPEVCLNLGLTYNGVASLHAPASSLSGFPEEFVQGTVARAALIGDTGDSAPEHWKGRLASPDVHVLLFLFAQSGEVLEEETVRLRRGLHAGFSELSVHEARALPDNLAHFGYRDGFSPPTVLNGLPPLLADVLPKAPTGEFLLGHPSQYAGFQYPVPSPPDLGFNGTFLAFRILAQDCHGFEEFLSRSSQETGLDRELIAAKLCGRWRSGAPLSLSPDSPGYDIPVDQWNSFDYAPAAGTPEAFDDRKGTRCPIGAHIRRMNPRNSTVAGNSGLKRRIIRRGLPYGPTYDAAHPGDGIERGLLGIFIGVSLKDQFEFLMSDWANGSIFAPGLRGTKDPIIGDNSSPEAKFLIPLEGRKTIELSGMPRFVTTRGSAYCFLPSATATRFLAGLPDSPR